jgi:outer membrane immunogenic protein
MVKTIQDSLGVIMKKLLGLALAGALSVAALPTVAAAQAPLWTWTGFYIGVQGGGVTSGWFTQAPAFPAENGGIDGAVFGGTLGWNWQSGIWVLGVEGDWSWSNASGRAVCGAICGPDVNSLATVRLRLGVASLGSTLFYVTGGGAWANVSSVYPALGYDESRRHHGLTFGGGVEFMLAPNWTIKGEALWVDLSRENYPDGGLRGVAAHPLALDFIVFRGGANFRF